jgi:hypothetical protein
MEKFALFSDIINPKKPTTADVPQVKGIKYQQYEVEVEGKNVTVSIPLKESANFEQHLMSFTKGLTTEDLRLTLRQFRGIRG